MDSKIVDVILNGHNYAIWALDTKALLKTKGPGQYTKVSILDTNDGQDNFVIDGKKDEAVGVITTYI